MAETVQAGGTGLQRPSQSMAGMSAASRAMAVIAALQERLLALPAAKRNWLIGSVAFATALCAGMAWYAQRPDWRVLFNGLESKDVQQVSQELAAAGIPFQATPDGSGVEVPAESLDKARMEVAAKGMPQSGRLGFELFDKPNWVGSEFDEKVNYQRAMEGELEHTIETLDVVRSARVHLVLPQPSLFTSEEKEAKASVVLKLKRSSLASGQVEAIRSLIAGAVENLSPDQVTLVDADGRVNFKQRSNDPEDGVEAEQEAAMEAKLVEMLEPLAGRDNVRATVNVSYDQGSEERTDEVYDPAQSATLTMQKSDQEAGQPVKSSGVPGTASNSPVASAEGAVAGSKAAAAPGTPPLLQKQSLPVYPQSDAQGQSLHQENGTYGVSKHTVHSEQGPGRVRRITAAVVVNDRSLTEGTGKLAHAVWKPRSVEEMRRLEGLAQAAVGFDASRGDQVVVQNVSFSSNVPEVPQTTLARVTEQAQALLHSQPGLLRTAVMALCALLVALLVLRPVAKQMTAVLLNEPKLLPAGDGVIHAGLSGEIMSPGENAGAIAVLASGSEEALGAGDVGTASRIPRMGLFEEVTGHIRRDPAASKRLLEAWIAPEEVR